MSIKVILNMPDPVKDAIVNGKDPVRDWAIGFLGEKLGGLIASLITTIINTANYYSAEIIVTGVCACAIMIMLTSFTGNSAKWLGRLITTLTIGIIWRILI